MSLRRRTRCGVATGGGGEGVEEVLSDSSWGLHAVRHGGEGACFCTQQQLPPDYFAF